MLLDRFELLEEVGRGATGIVYRARERRSGLEVAVKLLRVEPTPSGSIPLHLRLQREASLLGRVRHPGVVHVLDACCEREVPYLVTEFVAGQPLDRILQQRGALPAQEIAALVVQAARALHAAHLQGVIHRDIKPANLLVAVDGTLKITDFGVAGDVDGDSPEIDEEGYVWGTPAYLSPERLRGLPIDGRADLYALGVVLYLGLTGRLPFDGESVREITHQVLHDHAPPIHRVCPAIDSELSALVARALSKDPSQRFADGESFARALEQTVLTPPDRGQLSRAIPIQRGGPSEETRRIPRFRHEGRRRVASALGAAAAVLALTGLASWLGSRQAAPGQTSPPESLTRALAAIEQSISPPAEAPAWIELPAPPPPVMAPEEPVQVASRAAPRVAGRLQPRARLGPRRSQPVPARSISAPTPTLPTVNMSRPHEPALTPASGTVPSEDPQAARHAAPIHAASTDLASSDAASTDVAAAPPPAEPARGVIELSHRLEEGLLEVRLGGRRVALVRLQGNEPVIASFRVPPGRQRLSLSLLSASSRVDTRREWTAEWAAGSFQATRLRLEGPDPEWRLVDAE